ncbi:hypothetical protein SALBM135S_06538 [Streptomyces alboniger]
MPTFTGGATRFVRCRSASRRPSVASQPRRAISEASSRVRRRSGFGRSRTHSETRLLEQPSSSWIWSYVMPWRRSSRARSRRSSLAFGRFVHAGGGSPRTSLFSTSLL